MSKPLLKPSMFKQLFWGSSLILFIAFNDLQAQTLTISNTGETGTSGTGWSISGNTLAVSADANIQASVVVNALASGALTITATNIIIDENISSLNANALTFKALGKITMKTTRSIQRTNGAVIFWSDADNTQATNGLGEDEIFLETQTSISTQGGNLVMAGGLDDGSNGGTASDGIPDNYAYRGSGNSIGGVNLGPSATTGTAVTLATAGGSITIRGRSAFTATDARPGVTSQGNFSINAGAGQINIEGVSSVSNGVEFAFGAIPIFAITSSFSGTDPAIRIAGGSSIDKGVYLSRSTSSSGSILIQSSSATGGGLLFEGSASITTADAVATNISGSFSKVRLLSGSSNITLTAASVGSFTNAVGAIKVYGEVRFGVRVVSGAVQGITPSVTSSNANVILRGNTVDFDPTLVTQSSCTGSFTIEPRTADNSFTSAVTIRQLNFTAVTGIRNSSLTVGKSTNTAGVTFASTNTISLPGPITAYAGTLTLDGDITTTATTGTGISLNATKIIQNTGADITTSGSNISYAVTNTPFTVDADVAMNLGPASGTKATISAGGGNISLTASFATSGANNSPLTTPKNDFAISTQLVDITTTGSGTITINGDAYEITNTNGQALQAANGIQFAANTLISSVNGNITITGRGGKSNSSNKAIVIEVSTAKILSTSGDILLDAKIADASWTSYNQTIVMSAACYIGADDLTSSSSNITVRGNGQAILSSPKLKTTGAIVFEPEGTTFVTALSFMSLTFPYGINLLTSPSSLRIGKATNTLNVTISNATPVAGPITVYGSTINVNNALTATNSTITLQASTAVTQNASGNITANGLALTGAGSVTLTNAGNSINTIAGGSAASRIGAINFNNNKALTVGTVNPTGIYSTGLVEIATTNGNLSITEPISSTLASSDAVKLYADKDEIAGNLGNGDIVISSNGSITVESGARALIYSAVDAYSTGLTTDVGGSGNSRTNVDATTSLASVSPALATSGKYALYRISNATLLPLTWLRFSGLARNGSVELNWSTTNEQNASHFDVERSADNRTFNVMGKVGAASNPGHNDYQFIDKQLLSGKQFYRLKQVDKDGRFEYSKILEVTVSGTSGIEVWSAPGSPVLTVVIPERLNGAMDLGVYDATGREVHRQQIVSGRLSVETSGWQSGVYFVRISSRGQLLLAEQFVK